MNSQVSLYDCHNIDSLDWSNSEISNLIKAYWVPMMKAGSTRFIENIDTQMFALTIDDLVLPVTVNDRELKNCYVCSPYNHYITYTKEELVTLKNPLLEKTLAVIIDFLGLLTAWGQINRVVIVHNLLLSTNLYPDLSTLQITQITEYLKNIFPNYAIVFRSINTFINDNLFNVFQRNNYNLIGSRQVYLFNPHDQSMMTGKMRSRFKQDTNLIKKSGYEVLDKAQLTLDDIPRIVELYNLLYLHKYSFNNPQFNEKFIELVFKNHTWHFQVLKKEGIIDGVIGFYEVNGMMTTPILGYDTNLPQVVGLYRMLSALLMMEATERGIILHQSSGAAEFKRFRGFVGNIEYSAVYHRHLPLQQRLVWWLLELLVNGVAVGMMERYGL
jgi:hypothetical protein